MSTHVTAYYRVTSEEVETFDLDAEPESVGYAEVLAELRARFPFDSIDLDDFEADPVGS